MKRIAFAALIVLFCAFAAPPVAHAGDLTEKQLKQIEEMRRIALRERAKQIKRDIYYLKIETWKLSRQVRRENIDNHETIGKYTKRVDDEYLDRLEDIAKTGDKYRWKEVRAEYMAARREAMKKDAARAREKNADKPNPSYMPPGATPKNE